MKLSYAEKVEIYNEKKSQHKSPGQIAKERNLGYRSVDYWQIFMVRSTGSQMVLLFTGV